MKLRTTKLNILCSTLLVLTLAALAATPALASGKYMEAVTTVEDDNGKVIQSQNMQAWTDGPKAKVVFQESTGNPMLKPGMYFVTEDGGETMFLVDPENQTYQEWDIRGMLSTVGNIMDSMKGLVNIEFSSPESELLLKEDGGRLLGYATTHYRYKTSYDMQVKVIGIKRTSSSETIQDLWTTTALGDPGMEVFLRKEPPQTGNEDLDRMIQQGLNRIDGVVLRSTSLTKNTDQKGNVTTSRGSQEVTTLRAESVSADTFKVPAGYTEQPSMFDGLAADSGESVDEEEEEDGVGGRFRRALDRVRGGGGR